jgi:hypothetical protein
MLVKQRLGPFQINWIKPFGGPDRPISPSGGGEHRLACCERAGKAEEALNLLAEAFAIEQKQ